jgi:hypothetical protein
MCDKDFILFLCSIVSKILTRDNPDYITVCEELERRINSSESQEQQMKKLKNYGCEW